MEKGLRPGAQVGNVDAGYAIIFKYFYNMKFKDTANRTTQLSPES